MLSGTVVLIALGLQWLPGNWLAVPGQEASILLGRTVIDDAKKLRRSLPRIEELRFGYVALEGARKICIDGPRMKRHADDVACAPPELDGERAIEPPVAEEPTATGELRESPLVPLHAYRVLVLHVGRGITPAATAEKVGGRGVRWKGTMRWQVNRVGWKS